MKLKKIDITKFKPVSKASYMNPEEKRQSLMKPKDKERVDKGKAIGAGKEAELQDLCEAHLVKLGIHFFHIPAASYKARGANVLAGIPDLLMFTKGENIDNHCLLVELKTKVGKQNPKQIKWSKETNVHVIRSFEGFKQLIEEWTK